MMLVISVQAEGNRSKMEEKKDEVPCMKIKGELTLSICWKARLNRETEQSKPNARNSSRAVGDCHWTETVKSETPRLERATAHDGHCWAKTKQGRSKEQGVTIPVSTLP